MPLTPRFSLEQNDDFVRVTIRVPHIRVSAAETHVEEDGCGVSFYCKPYLLKLRLPLPVRGEDDERCRAVYDPAADGGTVVLHLPKATAGQRFPDLDLTSALLQPKWDPSKELADRAAGRAAEGGAGIEVLASSTATDAPDSDDEVAVEVNDGSAQPPDAPCGDDDLGLGLGLGLARPRYGFNQSFSGFFRGLREELREMAQLPDPDATPEHERRAQREHAESLAFDEGRYLGDLLGAEEDVIFTEALAYQPDWINADSGFTEEEQAQMAQLPRKEYLIRAASREEWQLFQGLADIIFGYAYDQRTTQGEGNVESAWTIATLSATLSWFEVWGSDAQEAVAASARRSLCYPYLRHWQLTRACLGDVAAALRGGRRAALRCLLRVHAALARSEFHYLHNKLYISDCCVWLQTLGTDDNLREYANAYAEAAAALTKASVGLGLPEAEREYQAALFGPRSADTDDASGGIGSGGGGGSSSSGSSSDESDSESSSDDESYSDASLLSGSNVHPAAAAPPTTRGDAAAAAAAAAPATPAFSCTAAAAAAAAGAAAAPVENAQDSGHAAAAAARETHAAAAAAAGVEHWSALLNNADAPMLPPPPSPAVSSVATPIATDAAEMGAAATSDGSAGPQPVPSDGLDVPLPPPLSPAATADAAVKPGVCGQDGAKATHQRPLCVNPPSPPPCEGDREASVLRLLGGLPELTRRAAALSMRGADAEHENSTQAAARIQEL